MSCTVLMNAARGGKSGHAVEKEIPILAALEKAGWTAEQISIGTVKGAEELVRMGQVGGVAGALASTSYGRSWTF